MMSEPETQIEIEDVLSSIRRLVSREAGAARPVAVTPRAPAPVAMTPPAPVEAECLVLGPALRIGETAEPAPTPVADLDLAAAGPDASADVVVSSSCFEHVEFFWVMFNEVLRVLKPAGLFYLNAPSNGDYHRYPVDCWRFYPDAAMALVRWGQRSGYRPALLESFTTYQRLDVWNDSVAVFLKDEALVAQHPARMMGRVGRFMNGHLHGCDAPLNPQTPSEDGQKLARLTGHAKPRQ